MARAAYSQADVVLLDDSLSALDAYVGQAIVDNCILRGPLAGRTRILVTHTLHVLENTDYIYVMDNGTIIEHGTYKVEGPLTFEPSFTDSSHPIIHRQALMRDSVVFAHLIDEYGTHENVEGKVIRNNTGKDNMHPDDADQPDEVKMDALGTGLIQAEERATGSISWVTYAEYFRFAGSIFWIPFIIVLVLLSQIASGEFTKKDHEKTNHSP